MALPATIANETITRIRAATTTDAHGNATRDWATAAEETIEGCSVQPLNGDAVIIGRDSVTSRWQLFLPFEADLLPSDRVKHQDVTYEVDGSVQKWPDIAGLGHQFCFLRLVEG